jgi:hypothetical protein
MSTRATETDRLGTEVDRAVTAQLEPGRVVCISADADDGRMRRRGEVVFVGDHHFRMRCDPPLAKGDLKAGQKVEVRLSDDLDTLPLSTKFLRRSDEDPAEIVLILPTEKWCRNHRAYIRTATSLPVSVFRRNGSMIRGAVENISGGGVLIVLDAADELSTGEEIWLSMVLPVREAPLSVQSRVRWSVRRGERVRHGLEFLDIAENDRNTVCRMVLVQEFESRRTAMRELNGRSGSL